MSAVYVSQLHSAFFFPASIQATIAESRGSNSGSRLALSASADAVAKAKIIASNATLTVLSTELHFIDLFPSRGLHERATVSEHNTNNASIPQNHKVEVALPTRTFLTPLADFAKRQKLEGVVQFRLTMAVPTPAHFESSSEDRKTGSALASETA